jgi:hypothetical protein
VADADMVPLLEVGVVVAVAVPVTTIVLLAQGFGGGVVSPPPLLQPTKVSEVVTKIERMITISLFM